MFTNNSELAPIFKLLDDEEYTQLALMFFALIIWSIALPLILFGPVNNHGIYYPIHNPRIHYVGFVPILQEEPPA